MMMNGTGSMRGDGCEGDHGGGTPGDAERSGARTPVSTSRTRATFVRVISVLKSAISKSVGYYNRQFQFHGLSKRR